MEISVRKGDLVSQPCDLLVVSAFLGMKVFGGATGAVNAALGGKLLKYMKEDSFKAKLGATFVLRTEGEIPAKRVLVIGLGKQEDFELESVRQAAAASMNMAKSLGVKSVVCVLHGAGNGGLKPMECAHAIAEGVQLAGYTFDAYKSSKKEKSKIVRFDIVSSNGQDVRQALKGLELGKLMAKGTMFARDLVNTPAQDMNPERLVDAARDIAKRDTSIRVKVYDRTALVRMGAGGLLGVAQGSDHPPYLVHMVYKPKKTTKSGLKAGSGSAGKRVALVGKAVTFDSGGLSLKPADYMMTMKCDMAGSAAVLGAFSVIAGVAPACEVHGIFGAVENMPSGNAIRPGDVLTVMNKKTIEVLNTDAEGRLTLADTLTFATKQKPKVIIDLATLTGACMVALGEEITGIMSNNDKLASKLIEASISAGEKMWRLPLEKNYRKLLKSEIADIQNIGSRWGGALTAGLFLEEFVDKTPWAHLDIAGPAFSEREIDPYTHKGATGHGVRTLLRYLLIL